MRRLSPAFVILLLSTAAWAQAPGTAAFSSQASEQNPLSAIPSDLVHEAMSVSICASIGRDSETPSWQAKDTKYTVPGTSVSVKMISNYVAIVITVTPYKKTDGDLILVAQGQVWYKEGDSTQYRTTVNTLAVAFGEKVYFYPFGAYPAAGDPLRVELVLDKYVPPTRPDGVKNSSDTGAGILKKP